ncbi:MAG: acyl-CoA dehydrogenase family protein [Tepidiformaceae bacterium]
MDFGFSEDEIRFRDDVRAFVEREWGPADPVAGRDKSDEERTRVFRAKVADKGWFAMGWPEEYGGVAVSPMEKYILSREMQRVGAPFPLYNANVLGPLILKYGTVETKAEMLPKMRRGDLEFVLGFTEPETGSDLANLSTRAVRSGDGYIVNGQKLYGNPKPGEIMFLAARTDPDAPVRRGISVLLIDTTSEGFSKTENPTLSGSHVGATYYDDVFVPRARLLGEENKGWDYVRESLDLDRLGGIPYAHFSTIFGMIIDYAKTTVGSDGRPLSDQAWVQERLAELDIEIEAAQLIQDMTASKVAAGEKLRIEASIVKIFCTELESRIAAFGSELIGTLAPLRGEDVHPLVDALSFLTRLNVAMTIVGGTNEIQRNVIALQGLGLPRS